MRCHANARLSPIGRRLLVDRVERDGWSILAAAESAGVSPRTVAKWLARWRAEGPAGLVDRSSAPRRVANRTSPQTERVIAALRRLRFTAPELSELLGLPCSTVSAVCLRLGMGKLGRRRVGAGGPLRAPATG
jgi:transposase